MPTTPGPAHGRRVGLITDEAWADFEAKQRRMEGMKQLLERTRLTGTMADQIQQESLDLSSALGQPLAQTLKRPEVTIENYLSGPARTCARFFRQGFLRDLCAIRG